MKTILAFITALLFLNGQTFANVNSTACQSSGGDFLSQLIGTWDVSTKDRTSPGNYEENEGYAIITASIEGCGVHESFSGTFRESDFKREVILTAQNASELQLSSLDSGHGSFTIYKGSFTDEGAELMWYRDENVKRLQSKYVLTVNGANEFELSSYLSTDTGKTWALTHQRVYTRKATATLEGSDTNADFSTIQGLLDAYYASISGPIGQPREFDRLRSLFHPSALLKYTYWSEESGSAQVMVMEPEEFIGKLDYTDKRGFYEHEISNVVHSFSSITQVFSTYSFRTEDKFVSGQGITSYELFFDGKRYWITSMIWAAEDGNYKIPPEYLKK